MKTIDIKGKPYVQVHTRIKEANKISKGEYSVTTNYEYIPEAKMFIVHATLTIRGQTYNGTAQEIIGESFINKTSALENAETSAVGRALGMADIGLLESGLATADEVQKADKISGLIEKPDLSKESLKKMKAAINNGEQEAVINSLSMYKITTEQRIEITTEIESYENK